MKKEDFKKDVELFIKAENFEKLSVTYDQYHGINCIVGDKEVLEELLELAEREIKNIYEYLNIKE